MGSIFWAISTAVFAILEVIIPGLVTIWLALAALIVPLLSGFINNSLIEFFIFAILSLVFIMFSRPVLQKYMEKKNPGFNSTMVNTELKVEKVVNTNQQIKEYEVKFKGSVWTAISEELFKSGDTAKIKSFEGNKIVLKK